MRKIAFDEEELLVLAVLEPDTRKNTIARLEEILPEVKDDFLKASSLLWALTWNVNTLIEPVLIDARHPSPLYEDVLQTGVCI